MRRLSLGIGVVVGALILPNPASAQATGTVLLGLMTVDAPRASIGVGFGYSPSIVGFEIEYLGALSGESADHPSAGGIFANLVVRPVTRGNLQFFVIGGFGLWGETFADGRGTGELGARDLGGGVIIRIAEPLGVRLDYRLFLLGNLEDGSRAPSRKHPQRFSAGLHVVF